MARLASLLCLQCWLTLGYSSPWTHCLGQSTCPQMQQPPAHPSVSLTWVFKSTPDWFFWLFTGHSPGASTHTPEALQRTWNPFPSPGPAPPGVSPPQGMAAHPESRYLLLHPCAHWWPKPVSSQYIWACPSLPSPYHPWLTCLLPPHSSDSRASPWGSRSTLPYLYFSTSHSTLKSCLPAWLYFFTHWNHMVPFYKVTSVFFMLQRLYIV